MSNVLITDDNEQNLYLASFLLTQGGHTVEKARNGREAVELIDRQLYDLVLMDIQMPVMNGLEATEEIKAKYQHVPVVALTAKAMSGDRERILSAGFDGYINKPIEPGKFLEQLAAWLE